MFLNQVNKGENKMDKKLLKVYELEAGKIYDMVNNPYPDHILYYVDEEGGFCQKDLIVVTQGKRSVRYNEVIKHRFYEV
jgi:hypothetical protein